jgi:hypothetical protein
MRDDPDTHPNANREPLAVAHPDPDTVANADPDTVAHADSDTDTDADPGAEPDSDAGTNTHANPGAEPDSDARANTHAHARTDPDTVDARPCRGPASGIRRHATWAVDRRRHHPGDARVCVLQGRQTRLID